MKISKKTQTSKKDKIKAIIISDIKGVFRRNPIGRLSDLKVDKLVDKLDKV